MFSSVRPSVRPCGANVRLSVRPSVSPCDANIMFVCSSVRPSVRPCDANIIYFSKKSTYLWFIYSRRCVVVCPTELGRVARSPVFSGSSRISVPISRLPDRSQNLPYLTRRSLASEINVLETGKTAQFELPQKPMKLDKTD